ncbi:MAG TPA: GNAT family N-acetyltransferase [Pyrinomonadaceae bacterium]|nr:GNAT family N-acetyltransferase [Pyrinomonadaceae bacterium]
MVRDKAATVNAHAREGRRVTVTLSDPSAPESLLLVEHLWKALGQLYGNTGPCQFVPADVEGAGTAFVVARLDGRPVGCGAIRPHEPGVAEVKRMYVEPAARGLGVGRRILQELESVAGALGYVAIRLETGVKQPAAISLYERAGYQRIERYGTHAEDPLSICMEKRLGEGARL